MAITVTPPTTPPTMAPVFELLPTESEIVGKDEDDAEFVGVREVPVGPVMTELGEPINEPGPISGLSPAANDLFASHAFSRVMSRRAHRGTCVPAGTGLGKVEGGIISVQLNINSDHVTQLSPWHAPHAHRRE